MLAKGILTSVGGQAMIDPQKELQGARISDMQMAVSQQMSFS